MRSFGVGSGGNERLEKSEEGCAFAFAGYGGTRQGVTAGVAPGSMRMWAWFTVQGSGLEGWRFQAGILQP